MSHKVKFTAEGPLGKYEIIEDLLEKEGFKLFDVKLIKKGERNSPKQVPHNTYKKPAMELVYDALNGNKGTAISISQLKKAMNMPMGTISGSLAKLSKLGRIEHAERNKWKVKT